MNICRISTLFVPPWSGLGPGPYEISKSESENGHTVVVITKGDDSFKEFDSKQSFRIIRIPVKRDLFFNLLLIWEFFKLTKETKIDLVHSHGPSGLSLILLRNWFKIKFIPKVVSSIHVLRFDQIRKYQALLPSKLSVDKSPYFSKSNLPKKRHFWKSILLDSLVIRYSNQIAVVNDYMKKEIMKKYPDVQTTVVYNGVSTEFLEEQIKNDSTKEIFRILFVGRLNYLKGEIELVKALKSIVNKFNIEITFLGDGPAKKHLKDYCLSNMPLRNFTFVSNVSHNEIRSYYNSHDLFILPSYSEGFPKVLVEAMSQNVTVLVSDIEAHTSIIKDGVNGFLFEVGNEIDLRNKIEMLILHKELLLEVRQNAKNLVRENYTWSKVVGRLNTIFIKVLEK